MARFRPPTIINVGGKPPAASAILDVDGDGDLDINRRTDQLQQPSPSCSNNGAGVFSAPTTFEGGVDGEYGLNRRGHEQRRHPRPGLPAAENSQDRLDPPRERQTGPSRWPSTRSLGGANWVIVCADLNNDGQDGTSQPPTRGSGDRVHSARQRQRKRSSRPRLVTTGGSKRVPRTWPTSMTMATRTGSSPVFGGRPLVRIPQRRDRAHELL